MKNSKINKVLIVGFITILIMMMLVGIIPLFMFQKLALGAKKIYEHPFTVSNTARSIREEITKVNAVTKEIIFDSGETRINENIDIIRKAQEKTKNNIKEINKLYLGNKNDIKLLKNDLALWETEINISIQEKISGKKKKAINSFENSQSKLVDVDLSLGKVLNFAYGKAFEFYTVSFKDRKNSFTVVIILLSSLLILAIFIKIYILVLLNRNQSKINRYMHLIDQHINILKFDSKTKSIFEVTNSSLRLLKLSKNEIIGNNFLSLFIGEDNEKALIRLTRTIETGTAWIGHVKRYINENEEQWIELNVQPELDKEFKLNQFNVIMSDATYEKKVEKISLTDELTGIYNRRSFNKILLNQLRVAARNKNNLTLAIADLDHFKKFNDRYGHPAGDDLLFKIANEIKSMLHRANDEIFRIGGEEFAIIFSNLTREESENYLNKIREKIKRLNIPHTLNDVSQSATISIGAKIYIPDSKTDPDIIYREADEALYDAKKTRNTVVVK